MRATVIKILVFGAFVNNLCTAQTYRSQIRYLEENASGSQENQVEPVELKSIQKFHQPVVVPQVLNLPMFRYRLLPNPYLYPSRDSLQPRSQYASYPTYTAYYNPSTVLDHKPQDNPARQPRLEDTSSEAGDSLQFKYRLIPPPPVDQVITPAPTPPSKVYSYSPMLPPNTNVVNSLPPLKKPEYLGGFIQPPAALHSYHQYPGYFPEPYIIEKNKEVASAGKQQPQQLPQKKKTGHTIKKTKPSFPKQPRTVFPPPDIEHVAPPFPQKENQRNGKSFSKLETEEAATTSSTTTEATKPTFATASVKVNHIKAANEEEEEMNLTSSIKAIEEDETPKPLPVEFARGPKFTSFDVKIDERKPRKTDSILAPLPPVNEIIRPVLNNKEEDEGLKPYGYEYEVNHEGHAYGHRETTSNGRTEGQYQVVLPDGRVQTVKYFADNSGFHPQIIYTQ